MEFQYTKAEYNFRYANENYDYTMSSPNIYEDPLQTVPDLECFELKNKNNNNLYSEQAVPEKCFYGGQMFSQSCETTPVRMEGAVFAQKRKITPLALTFEDDSSDSPTTPDSVTSCQPVKRRKKNRRSYLSSDLPEEIRNQRRTVANARERARVGRMANGYDALQKALPNYLTTSKMRKVDILNSAVCHIQNLMRLLAESKQTSADDCDTDTANFRNYWDRRHEEIEKDLLQYEICTDLYAPFPHLSVESCSFLEQ